MNEEFFSRLYSHVLLNRAYLRTVLANQCIILSNQSGIEADHKELYNKFSKEVNRQFQSIMKEDKQELKNRGKN